MGAKHQTGLTLNKHTRGEKFCRNLAALLSSFLLAFVFASIFTPVESSSATTPDSATVNVSASTNPYSVSLTASSSLNLNIDASPSGNIKAISDTLNVKTNVSSGYKLYLSTTNEGSNIYNTDDVDKVSKHFSPTTGTLDNPIALSPNTWGFKLEALSEVPDPTTTFSAVSTTPTKIKETDTITPDSGDNIDISYGFNVNTALPSGSYKATILYTVYAESADNLPTMQDFTTTECNNMNDNEITTLLDKRDGKAYRITKMKDGNCWMSQNLAYDGGVMTPEDSNVTTTRDLSGAVVTNGNNEYDAPQIYNANALKTTTDCGSYTYCVESNEPYGNLYNWNAATAGLGKQETTGTIYESVCPKGWRLPDNGLEDSNGNDLKSWSNLMKAYGLPTTNTTRSVGNEVRDMQGAPFYIATTGYYENSSYYGLRRHTQIWSRTVNNDKSNAAYYLAVNAEWGDILPQYSGHNKIIGISIRCVFEGNEVRDNMFMQDITLTMCNNLTESTASTDNRKIVIDGRDEKTYKISKLADNNCWMVQDLALDGGTYLYPGSSNVTAKRDLTSASISNGTATAYDTPQIYVDNATNYTSSCGTYPYCVESTEPYGNLYNWNAATATVGLKETTGTVYESICPTGWRLPDHGISKDTDTTQIKSILNLFKRYTINLDGTGTQLSTTNTYSGDAGEMARRIQQAPLYVVLDGVYYDGSSSYQGNTANLWTRTSQDTTAYPYYLNIYTSRKDFAPQACGDRKDRGISVRCVLGE